MFRRSSLGYEEEVQSKFRRLRGAPRQMYRLKWMNIITRLLATYHIDDPQILGLPYDLSNLEAIEKWLIERCHGLTEPECMGKIRDEIRKYGHKKLWEDTKHQVMDYIEYIEQRASEISHWTRVFDIPVDITPEVAEELKQLYENPDLDHDTVYRIIFDYLKSLGWEDKDADEIARKSADVIEKIKEKRQYATAEWTQILNYATVTAKNISNRMDTKADKLLRKYLESLKGITTIILERELEYYNAKVTLPRRSRTIGEGVELLKKQGAEEALVGIDNSTIVKYGKEKLICRAKNVITKEGREAVILENCNMPVLVIKVKDGKVYYQIVPPYRSGKDMT